MKPQATPPPSSKAGKERPTSSPSGAVAFTVEPAGRGATRSAMVAVVAFVVAAAFGLRLVQIGVAGLWFDDAHSVHMARLPLGSLVAEVSQDIHPPLYFFLLGIWMQLAGSGEFALRYFTVLTGLPTVPLLYVVARRLGGVPCGIAAALVAALSPLLIYYSQEVRMYAGSVSLVVAVAYFGWRAIQFEAPRRWLVPYVAVAGAAGYTHLFNLAAVGVLNFAYLLWAAPALLRIPRQPGGLRLVGWWVGAQLAVGLTLLPWLPVLVRKDLVGADAVWRPLEALGPALASLGQALTVGVFPVPGGYAWLAWGVWFPAAVGALVAAVRMFRGKRLSGPALGAAVGVIWLIAGFVLVYVSLAGRRDLAARYLLVVFPGFVLLVAGGLSALARWPRAYLAGMAAVVVLFAFPLVEYYRDPALPRPDDRGAVRWVESLSRPGDALVFNAHYQSMVYEYYGTRNLPVASIPDPELASHRASEPGVLIGTEKALAEVVSRNDRLWVVYWQDYFTDPDQIVARWLDNNLVRFQQNVFNDWIRVKGYEVRIPAEITFGGVIRLTGYEVTPWPLQPGEIATVKLDWLAVGRPAKDYQVFVHVVNKDYKFAAQHDGPPERGKGLTSTWVPGRRVTDVHDFTVSPDAASGEYYIRVGFYSLEDMRRLSTGSSDNLVVTTWPLEAKAR